MPLVLMGLLLSSAGCGGAPSETISAASPSPFLPQPSETPTPVPPTLTASPSPTPSVTSTPTITPTPTPAAPARFPDPAGYTWNQIATGLNRPIGIANAGDGSGRLFVLEQLGLIRIVQDGQLLPDPYLDIRDRVGCCGERGLLGLAFHPQFAQNGYFYVNYTDRNGDTVISRFQASTEDPQRVDPASESQLLGVAQPFRNHNGGVLAFGPDGTLYIGLGDGGSQGDPRGNGQNTRSLLGKILRLDVDSGDPYAIPPDNPFVQRGGAPEVWAYGLRNPWRFSFDRLTGDLYIGDVGQNSYEEIDFLPAGSQGPTNFGWNYREGAHPYAGEPAGRVVLTDPVAEYGRDQGITVIGGYVYRGDQLLEWQGIYVYGDYGTGLIWGLFLDVGGAWQNSVLFQSGLTITSFGEDESGELYVVDYSGSIYRLEGN
jgi:glucose/arabinose dehydrogenase